MAVSLNLITFSGGTVAPKTDGIIYDSAIGQCGVFYGCNVTANGNTVYVSNGYGMIRGRFFEMNDSSVPVTLSPSGTLIGRIYLRLDLSNTTDPLQLLVTTGATLPDLTQEEDANFANGVWEMELATFEITTSAIENVAETFATIEDNNSRIDELNSNLGVISPLVSGSYTTKKWAIGTRTATWTAPASGTYLIFMYISLANDALANRQAYKQLQFQGTATIPINALYYDFSMSNETAFVGRTIVSPIIAEAGQTVYPYIHTDKADVVYNYTMFSLRLK